jgi:DNA-binding XRE family transcriptional regulator
MTPDELIKTLRADGMFTLREVAKMTGLSASTIHRIEKGKDFGWFTFQKICKKMDVQISIEINHPEKGI